MSTVDSIFDIVIFIIIIFYVVFESTLLNCTNTSLNWTFQRFARIANKKERNGTDKKSDNRLDNEINYEWLSKIESTVDMYMKYCMYTYYIYYIYIYMPHIYIYIYKTQI